MAIDKRPGFFADWGRLGLGTALKKRWSVAKIHGRVVTYNDVLKYSHGQLTELMNMAIAENQLDIACWAFEGMLIQQQGNVAGVWPTVAWVLDQHRHEVALPAAQALLRPYVSGEQAKELDLGPVGNLAMGQIYLGLAQGARGSNKQMFLQYRPMALHFLGQAREQAADPNQRRSTSNPYAQAAAFAAVAGLAAAAYDTSFHMAYKGTRDTSSTSTE